MPITINKTNNTTSGFCHEYTVAIKRDGSVEPANIILGNQGDNNITKIRFDISDLDIPSKNSKFYNYFLVVKDLGKIDINSGEGVVSSSFTSEVVSYDFLYVVEEKQASTNNSPNTERFVSNSFTGIINSTSIDDLNNFDNVVNIENEDSEVSFYKADLLINIDGNHYNISANSSSFGNKFDSYIKNIVLNTDLNELDPGLVNRYCVIYNDKTCYKIKMSFDDTRKHICSCLIPSIFTSDISSYNMFFIAQSKDLLRQGVSPSLVFNTNDNCITNIPIENLEELDETLIISSDNIYLYDCNNEKITANGVI